MTHEQSAPAADASDVSASPETTNNNNTQPNMVPYERFAEVNRQLKALKTEMAERQLTDPKSGEESAGEKPTPEDICRQIVEDPEGYFNRLAELVVREQVRQLHEEMALRHALQTARRQYPEFKEFEPYIMQEIASALDDNPELEDVPWEDVLKAGLKRLQSKFKSAVGKGSLDEPTTSPDDLKKAFMEGSAPRKAPAMPPVFTRAEIAKMSMKDFMKYEEAINEALKNNRIT